MASNIVIITSPPETSPIYNKIEYCVEEQGTPDGSSISALTNYNYVIDIERS